MPILFKFVGMAKGERESKARAEYYDPELSINGTFADVIGVAMKPKEEKKKWLHYFNINQGADGQTVENC